VGEGGSKEEKTWKRDRSWAENGTYHKTGWQQVQGWSLRTEGSWEMNQTDKGPAGNEEVCYEPVRDRRTDRQDKLSSQECQQYISYVDKCWYRDDAVRRRLRCNSDQSRCGQLWSKTTLNTAAPQRQCRQMCSCCLVDFYYSWSMRYSQVPHITHFTQ